MSPEQIAQLLRLLERIADRPFTITQATDWPMVYVFMGVFIAAMGLFWRDVGLKFADMKSALKDFKGDDEKAHANIKIEYEKADELIWKAMKDCQGDCCPPRRRETDK